MWDLCLYENKKRLTMSMRVSDIMSDIDDDYISGLGDWREIHEDLDRVTGGVAEFNRQVKAGSTDRRDIRVEDIVDIARMAKNSLADAKAKVEPVLKSTKEQLLLTRKHSTWLLSKRLEFTVAELSKVSQQVHSVLTAAEAMLTTGAELKRIKQEVTAQDVVERLQWLETHGVIPRVVPAWVDDE